MGNGQYSEAVSVSASSATARSSFIAGITVSRIAYASAVTSYAYFNFATVSESLAHASAMRSVRPDKELTSVCS